MTFSDFILAIAAGSCVISVCGLVALAAGLCICGKDENEIEQ